MESSAEKIRNNQDILTQILLRLPTKSLLRLMCVSKQWLRIISEPQFCDSHTRRQQHNGFLEPTALLLKVKSRRSRGFDMVPLKNSNAVPFFNPFVDGANINMLQSCNGLFLCEAIDGDNGSWYFICNPTTKKFKKISFPRERVNGLQFYVNFAFDPLKTRNYKIISILKTSLTSKQFEIDIYRSKTDSWTASVTSFEVDIYQGIRFEEPIFCNGMIHWKCYGKRSWRFDVKEERCQEMPMPTPRDSRFELYRYFGESRGTLYLVFTYLGSMYLEVDVNQMEPDYSKWLLKLRLNLGDAMEAFRDVKLGHLAYCPGFSGLSFIPSENEREPKVVLWSDGIMILYDFNDGTWKKLHAPGIKIGTRDLDILERLRALAYFENLSCI